MLTLKHIIWNGGFETVYQAKQVRSKYREPRTNDGPHALEFVAFDLPNGDVHTLTFGKIYVMNEAGRTVASYDFGRNEPASAVLGNVTNQYSGQQALNA